jgi:hypothetical protein
MAASARDGEALQREVDKLVQPGMSREAALAKMAKAKFACTGTYDSPNSRECSRLRDGWWIISCVQHVTIRLDADNRTVVDAEVRLIACGSL